MSLAQILSSGLLRDEPVEVSQRPELFRKCCNHVCPDFVIDDTNRKLMNNLFQYAEHRNGSYSIEKGIWLWGNIGTGKSTIIKILELYDKLSKGLTIGGYPVGGFRIESASTVAGKYSMKGADSLESYIYNSGNPSTISFDELGREPCPTKYFGTELNVMQYVFQCRYELRYEALTHVTTNLSLEEVQNKYGSYIADRINEMFNVIELKGKSRR